MIWNGLASLSTLLGALVTYAALDQVTWAVPYALARRGGRLPLYRFGRPGAGAAWTARGCQRDGAGGDDVRRRRHDFADAALSEVGAFHPDSQCRLFALSRGLYESQNPAGHHCTAHRREKSMRPAVPGVLANGSSLPHGGRNDRRVGNEGGRPQYSRRDRREERRDVRIARDGGAPVRGPHKRDLTCMRQDCSR